MFKFKLKQKDSLLREMWVSVSAGDTTLMTLTDTELNVNL